jgi:hypothetical protein
LFLFVDSVAIVDGFNPLTMSQIAITCSCKAIVINNNIANARKMSNVAITEAIKIATAPMRPQIDNHRGMSFDLYNAELSIKVPMTKTTR